MKNPLLQSVQLALHNGSQVGALAYVDEIHKFISSGKYGEVLDDWEPLQEWGHLFTLLFTLRN